MRLLVLNPNSTAAMTESIAAAARAAARAGTEIVARNPAVGPAAIQGPEDGAACLPGLFALYDAETAAGAVDATLIACADDTGLWELKSRGAAPAIGVGEAGYHAATLMGRRFTVVTSLPISTPVLAQKIAEHGFAERCARIRASGVPVLDFETAKERATARLAEEIARAVAEDECDSIVLGCAGMADLAAEMTARFGLPVIDGVAAAVGFAETLGRART